MSVLFQNPLGWLALAAIAIPIVIHLIGRRPTQRQPFPTLQFLDATRILRVRRQRLTDIPGLLVRCGILAAAAVALTQPLWEPEARLAPPAPTLARAIVVDTAAASAARSAADPLAAEATVVRRIENRSLRAGVEGAAAWLATQPGQREVVVVSSFPMHALDVHDLDSVPANVGIRLVRIDAPPAAPRAATQPIKLLASERHRGDADAARQSATALGVSVETTAAHPLAIVFDDYAERATLLAGARPIDAPWMFDLVAGAHEELRRLGPDVALPEAVVMAIDAVDHLAFAVPAGADPVAGAAIVFAVSAAARALSTHDTAAATRSDDELRSWERPAAPPADTELRNASALSDGRWFWLVALLLLGLEWLMRGHRRDAPAMETGHARVA